MNPSITAL